MNAFCHFELRTSAVVPARGFYEAVLGTNSPLTISSLPPEAVARGAVPHWLGHIAVDALETTAAAWRARGATQIGPVRTMEWGAQRISLREPGGGICALLSAPPPTRAPLVTWHHLLTSEVDGAAAACEALFGWKRLAAMELAPFGTHLPFSWRPDGEPCGSISDVAQLPSAHPHWSFHFAVPSLDDAIQRALSGGGTALSPVAIPSQGVRVALCHDPHGAEFVLRGT